MASARGGAPAAGTWKGKLAARAWTLRGRASRLRQFLYYRFLCRYVHAYPRLWREAGSALLK